MREPETRRQRKQPSLELNVHYVMTYSVDVLSSPSLCVYSFLSKSKTTSSECKKRSGELADFNLNVGVFITAGRTVEPGQCLTCAVKRWGRRRCTEGRSPPVRAERRGSAPS